MEITTTQKRVDETMKYWTTKLLIFILLLLTALSAYNYFKKPFFSSSSDSTSALDQPSLTPTPTQVAKKTLRSKDKITQLLAVPFDLNEFEKDSSSSARMLRFIEDYQPGFVLYFGENIASATALLAKDRLYSYFTDTDYLPLLAVDHEGGLVQRLNGEGFSKLEPWQKIVTTYSSAQQKAVFNQSARELTAVGINVVFAPVVDLASQSAVLKTRAADDPEQVFASASNYILSFSQYGIMSVIKHFPGIGAIRQDPHQTVTTLALRPNDTAIWSKLLNKFPNIGVMTAHVRLENKLAGQICSLSAECLQEFTNSYQQVLLFTDDLNMKAAKAQGKDLPEKNLTQLASEAILAGNDVLVFGKGVSPTSLEEITLALTNQYEDSENFRRQVDRALAKILKIKK